MTPRLLLLGHGEDAAGSAVVDVPRPPEPRAAAAAWFGVIASAIEAGRFRPVVARGHAAAPEFRRMLLRAALAAGFRASAGGLALFGLPGSSGRPPEELGYRQVGPDPSGSPSGPSVSPDGRLWLSPGAVPATARLPGPGSGAFRPGLSTLLVCDGSWVARAGQLKHRLPFVSFDGHGDSGWLAEQLESAGAAEEGLYWVNAHDARGTATDPSFVDDLRPALTVALGGRASFWCKSVAGLQHLRVDSPRSWRYDGTGRYPLVDLL